MFRTELSLRPAAQLLSTGARVLTIGSCFSDVIGQRLAGHKVRTLVNPFGTVFNPLAAARLLRAVAGEETDWQQHVVEARGRVQSYDLHASVGADSPPALLERIEETVRETAEFARRADVLVWTLGTAYGYRLRDTGEIVSNCHKMPSDRFEKELLTAEEIVTAVTEAYALLRQQNPQLQLILTVSPVRHLKDTLPLNAVSKSVLRVACHYLSELLPGASYFPAYELLVDDLRDYRFYGADMIHPSDVAEQYVWEKFTGVYFDADFRQFAQEWVGIQRALNHRPLHDGAPEHREFLEQTQRRLEQLLRRNVDVRLELLDVQDRLDALPLPTPPAAPEDVDDGEERIDVGYEDAATSPAAPKAVAEPAAEAPPKVAEPTWAEILSAEEAGEGDADEEGDESAAASNEAEANLPGEAGVGKRRKRKRGGRKHKKKGGRSGEELAAAAEEGAAATSSVVVEPIPAEAGTEAAAGHSSESKTVGQPPAENQQLAAEVAQPPLLPVEQPAAEEPLPAPAGKRRNRGKRKKPALYAETPTPAEPVVVPVLAEETPTDPNAEPIVPVPEVSAVALPPVEQPAPLPQPAPEPEPVVDERVELAEAPAEVSKKAPARRSSRSPRKTSKAAPAPAEAGGEAPAQPVAALPEPSEAAPAQSAPTPEAAPKPAARRAAPRRKPVAKAAPAPAEPVAPPPAPAPEPAAAPAAEAPKKRSRAPRRKPDAPEAS